MSWVLLVGLALLLGVALLVGAARRNELRRMRRSVDERERVVDLGASEAELMHPVVDLSRCLGCATCVASCPEQDVLAIVHGQAKVINGSQCQGISACERECPVGAITVTLAGAAERRDIPVLDDSLEATGSPGLFLAGEVTARALIKTAIEHGTAVAAEVAHRKASSELDPGAASSPEMLDLCIVGAGPAGLACALEAKRTGLSYVVLEQEQSIGGTVAKYPRRKLVLTQPVDLPLHGRLEKTSYMKEELIDLWRRIVQEHELTIACGEVLDSVERGADGQFVVTTGAGTHEARNVCLALGRRGIPRRLGIPGEALPKVVHSLVDARSHSESRILVVGGGDTAVEAAIALAEQAGNRVTLSYRKSSFFRIKRRNEEHLSQLLSANGVDAETSDTGAVTARAPLASLLGSPHPGTPAPRASASNVALEEPRLQVFFDSEVLAVSPTEVELRVREGAGTRTFSLPNDEVFVMIGGTPPIDLLERSGVSFDPAERPAPRAIEERGTGVLRALTIAFAIAVIALVWAIWHGDYYLLQTIERPTHDKHTLLRPGMGIGLALGFASAGLIAVNLLYLVRRSTRFRFEWGSLASWMTSHLATGVLAFLCALLHGAMAPKDTPGGHALWALAVLTLTGAIGRYLYAYVPRAANGRELELEEVRSRLRHLSDTWADEKQEFGRHVREEIAALVANRQWRGSFVGRALALVGLRLDLHRVLTRLRAESRAQGIAPEELERTLAIAREAHSTALAAAHLEDLRAVLGTWRYLHRWVAALMVVLLVLHVWYALSYSSILGTGGIR